MGHTSGNPMDPLCLSEKPPGAKWIVHPQLPTIALGTNLILFKTQFKGQLEDVTSMEPVIFPDQSCKNSLPLTSLRWPGVATSRGITSLRQPHVFLLLLFFLSFALSVHCRVGENQRCNERLPCCPSGPCCGRVASGWASELEASSNLLDGLSVPWVHSIIHDIRQKVPDEDSHLRSSNKAQERVDSRQ